jgi:NitT/TauT family transport system ATP-binding protein
MATSNPKLLLRNVTRRYRGSSGEVHALDDVSLEVAEGEFLMLVGPSGCGKSTLLNIVAGLDHADEGDVLVDGLPVLGPGRDRALVFQDGALFPWLTVIQNVEFGLREAGIGKAERREKANRYLSMVGLSRFTDHAIHELSGGMKQRVALVRALVLEPKVLLMDEPFSALDAMTREDLYVELQSLWQERSTTVVFVTHNVREAVTLGDRVVIMAPRPGRVLQDFPIGILRPRQIDDVDVARTAQEISLVMKDAGIRQEEVAIEKPLDEDRVLRSSDSSVGAAR